MDTRMGYLHQNKNEKSPFKQAQKRWACSGTCLQGCSENPQGESHDLRANCCHTSQPYFTFSCWLDDAQFSLGCSVAKGGECFRPMFHGQTPRFSAWNAEAFT